MSDGMGMLLLPQYQAVDWRKLTEVTERFNKREAHRSCARCRFRNCTFQARLERRGRPTSGGTFMDVPIDRQRLIVPAMAGV
jgi:hypothetical protein